MNQIRISIFGGKNSNIRSSTGGHPQAPPLGMLANLFLNPTPIGEGCFPSSPTEKWHNPTELSMVFIGCLIFPQIIIALLSMHGELAPSAKVNKLT